MSYKNMCVMKKEIVCLCGFYCALVGALGILALIFFGFLVWHFRLSSYFFWALLGSGFGVAAVVAGYCLACNCKRLGKCETEGGLKV